MAKVVLKAVSGGDLVNESVGEENTDKKTSYQVASILLTNTYPAPIEYLTQVPQQQVRFNLVFKDRIIYKGTLSNKQEKL